MRQLGVVATVVSLGSLALQPLLASAQGETEIHEKGRCAIRGHCGKKSIFGGELPCPDNGLAHQPEDPVRQKLVNLCGPKWEEGPLCCREEQVRSRTAELTRGIILIPLLSDRRALEQS